MSFPAYPEYKRSGVEWLGAVPEHWSLHKLKYIARFSGGGTPSRENLAYWNGDIPWVSPKDMKLEVIAGTEESITVEGLRNSTTSLVSPGGVLIVVRSGILKHTVPVATNNVEVALNQDMKALRFDPKLALFDFFFRWVQGFNSQLLNVWLKQGATVESIEQEYLAGTIVPMPSIDEQRMIVTFLDHETGRIDALIEEQQRLIELLKEKRQAVISHAVTKGLAHNVPMKDSGVEWLGKVPAHWAVRKLKNLVSVRGGSTPSKEVERYWEGNIPWVSPKDMKSERISNSIDHVSSSAIEDVGLNMVESGTILIVVRGMILIHSVPVAITDVDVTINQDMKAMTPCAELSSDYLLLLLQGVRDAVFQYIDSSAHGTRKLEWERFELIDLPIPSHAEQIRIVSSIEMQKRAIDDLTKQASSAITLMKERRSALISAAVTGKIDVRDWQPPVSAPSPELAQEAM